MRVPVRVVALGVLATINLGVSGGFPTSHHARPARTAASITFADRPLSDVLLGATAHVAPPASPAAKAATRSRPAAKPKKALKPLASHGRYVPTGLGMWTYMWSQTEHGNARAVVKRAKFHGITHLYVRTGSRKGFDGGPTLQQILPATKGTNIKVIA